MQKIGCGIKSVKGNFDSVKMLMLGGFIAMIKLMASLLRSTWYI